MSTRHRFGPYEIRPTERRLLKDGRALALGARAFDVLMALIERRDRLVTKAELLDAVWPDVVVEEANVQVQVSSLRKLLGSRAIATIPGRGYQFSVPLDSDDVAATAAGAARAARPSTAAPTNLPGSTDALIGREDDVAWLTAAMAQHRLVTVLGPGGIGKTRVAQEAARRQVGLPAHGVWWVDLAPLSNVQHMVTAIANAAHLQLGDGSGDPLELLLHSLAHHELLLVLDNCERLVQEVARFAHAVHAAASGVRLLVTSQEALRCAGERVYRLEPLAVPPPGSALDAARGYSAVQLLEQRAQAADRRFALGETNVQLAVELLRRLDGIPLAIEIAAARIPLLGLDLLHQRVGEWLRLLRRDSRSAAARHQTLRATLEWSYSLLNEPERTVLRRLSLFAASFRVDVAQRAAADGDLDEWLVLDALSALVDKSLVQAEPTEPPRYRLLETMRMFAAEQLALHGEADDAQQRHCDAMAQLALEVEQSFWQMPDSAWLARSAPEYDNLRTACDGALVRRDADAAALIGAALMRLDRLRSVIAPRRRRAEALHTLLPGASAAARAWIWTCITSHGLISVDTVPPLEAAREAVAAWRALGDRERLYVALGFEAWQCSCVRDFEAADRLLAELRSLEQPGWPLRRLMWGAAAAAGVCLSRGDAAGYREASRRELALAERAGADRTAALARLKLADAALMAGDHGEAIELCRAAVAALRLLDQPANLGLALSNLCAALLLRGEHAAAREAAVEALPLMWHNSSGYLLLDPVALLAARDGHAPEAAQVLGYVDAWYARRAAQRQPNEARLASTTADVLDRAVSTQQLPVLRAEGAELDEAAVLRLARTLLAG
ncbi:ATP-binding protein [Piscinibacter sp.]|uniref:ATP-binding protein n=1 Tax=Piscinibacter sp. TaxID=1903157 RepID=UPI002F3FE829